MSTEMIVTLTVDQLREIVRDAAADAVCEFVDSTSKNSNKKLIDKKELACALGCSVPQIDKLRRVGLPTIKVGDAVRFEADAVIEWLRGRGEQ